MAYGKLLLLLTAIALVSADVSHILEDPSTEPPPPLPYSFSYTAGRVIAEQHARIAAEREALQREEEERQHLQELQEIGN
ncbi:hypothetical protein RR48_01497 [Papilio machaon]|uniref:Uncharacterized protein n=1 Tax=Papilio machaon TaxID=76193 RepID=A0A0N1IPA9_PAPMA|nr:hypothetical protein RR48_01497 [Papilio machaon]